MFWNYILVVDGRFYFSVIVIKGDKVLFCMFKCELLCGIESYGFFKLIIIGLVYLFFVFGFKDLLLEFCYMGYFIDLVFF